MTSPMTPKFLDKNRFKDAQPQDIASLPEGWTVLAVEDYDANIGTETTEVVVLHNDVIVAELRVCDWTDFNMERTFANRAVPVGDIKKVIRLIPQCADMELI